MSVLGTAGLLGSLLAGMGLGALFFGGLWLTLRHTLSSWVLSVALPAGFILRTGVVLTGFYAIAQGGGQRLLACLLGFLAARWLVNRWVRTATVNARALGTPGADAP